MHGSLALGRYHVTALTINKCTELVVICARTSDLLWGGGGGSVQSLVYHVIMLLQVNVVRDKVTWPGAIIQKTGEGMPNYDNNKLRGTLFITIDVDFPRGSLPAETREGVATTAVCNIEMFIPVIRSVFVAQCS